MNADFITPFIPRRLQFISSILFDAHRRTINEGERLLANLRPMREALLTTYHGNEINFEASNGDRIDGLYFKGTEPKAIIFLHGNGCFYETSGMKPLAWRNALKKEGSEDPIPHLVLFNPRGTGESSGRTQTSFVIEDFVIIFDFLIKNCKVDPSHVVIGGHSMGGYFGQFGAAAIQQRYPEARINFISDRSLWDLRSRVALHVEYAGYTGRKATSMTSYIKVAISEPDWTRDSGEALECLKGRVLIIYNPKDGVIPYAESTHKGIKMRPQRNRSYLCLELSEKDTTAEIGPYPHNREFTDEEDQIIVAEIKNMLDISPTSEDESLTTLYPQN